jgi:hypothetical protein
MAKFLDAALRVMSKDRALTSDEIMERILKHGLLTTRGRTPAATLTAQLYLETKQPTPRVRRVFTPGNGRAAKGSVRWLRS